jgi:hypothetical protein
LKRKGQPPNKAPSPKRTKTTNAFDDPTRSFCLGKLEEVFHVIFLRYPHPSGHLGEDVEKKPEELSEEEKERVIGASKQFALELEQSIFDIYAETDKQGQPSAGKNYK